MLGCVMPSNFERLTIKLLWLLIRDLCYTAYYNHRTYEHLEEEVEEFLFE
jgi:hypothetical protein